MRIFAVIALIGMTVSGNAQQPGAPTWTLVEDLRIGGDQGPTSFNDVRSIVATKTGNIFVLDFKTQEIRLFDPQGAFLKLVARGGAGPGEIRNANGLAIGDNDIVWVNDPANGRFSLYRADGSFYKQVLAQSSGFGYVWNGVVDDRGRAIAPLYVQRSNSGEMAVRRLSESGAADTVPFPSCKSDVPIPDKPYLSFRRRDGGGRSNRSIPFLASPRVQLTRSGNAWCTPSSEYRLWVGPAGSANKEVITLKVAPIPVSAEERKKEVDKVDSIVRTYGPLTEGDVAAIPKVKPVIAAMHVDDRSRAWVHLTGSPAEAPVFEVFEPSGRMVARVNGKGKISEYITMITSTHVYTTALDADDVPTIVRYRIVK